MVLCRHLCGYSEQVRRGHRCGPRHHHHYRRLQPGPSFTAQATVTVEALPITVEGVLQTEEGSPVRFTWDMTRDNTWTAGIELDTDVLAATHNGKGTMYVTSGDGKL